MPSSSSTSPSRHLAASSPAGALALDTASRLPHRADNGADAEWGVSFGNVIAYATGSLGVLVALINRGA